LKKESEEFKMVKKTSEKKKDDKNQKEEVKKLIKDVKQTVKPKK